MKLIKQYSDYLRDNPERYWFKRKLYGWGWTPARPQGWVVVLAYLVGVVYFINKINHATNFAEVRRDGVAPIIVLTLLLIFISYWKGEHPRWQWGKKIDK